MGEEDRDGRTRIDEKPEFKFFKPTFFKPSAVPFVVLVRASADKNSVLFFRPRRALPGRVQSKPEAPGTCAVAVALSQTMLSVALVLGGNFISLRIRRRH